MAERGEGIEKTIAELMDGHMVPTLETRVWENYTPEVARFGAKVEVRRLRCVDGNFVIVEVRASCKDIPVNWNILVCRIAPNKHMDGEILVGVMSPIEWWKDSIQGVVTLRARKGACITIQVEVLQEVA